VSPVTPATVKLLTRALGANEAADLTDVVVHRLMSRDRVV
jgi:hypothetical protein